MSLSSNSEIFHAPLENRRSVFRVLKEYTRFYSRWPLIPLSKKDGIRIALTISPQDFFLVLREKRKHLLLNFLIWGGQVIGWGTMIISILAELREKWL